jgi:HEAT repeat protein
MKHILVMFALALAASPAHAIPELSDAQLSELAASAAWQDRQRAALARAWRDDPAAAQALVALQPGTTRAGGPRFVPPTRDAAATAVLLDRFLTAGDAPPVRAALLDALARTDGEWAPGVAAAFATEPAAAVRVVMLEVLRRQDAAVAGPVLRAGAKDADAAVREAAARSMGWTEDPAWGPMLQQALVDEDAAVRSAAARALGWVGASDAWTALVSATADADADVRRRALRALARLDGARAAAEPAVQARAADPDPKVARAAKQVVERAGAR